MRYLTFALLSVKLFFSTEVKAQFEHKSVDTTSYYQFEINYWFNMHHFLWNEAFLNQYRDSTLLDGTLSKGEKELLEKSIAYYANFLVDKDLRFDDYMADFKAWVTTTNDTKEVPEAHKIHFEVLKAFNDIYSTHFWPNHKEAIEQNYQEHKQLILDLEQPFWDQITTITGHYITDKVKVDLVYNGKMTERNPRNLPYTSIFPTHVVMNYAGEYETPGTWIELLFHESTHSLILTNSHFVSATINDVAEIMGERPPRGLWHAYLFYFSGYVCQQLLVEQGLKYPKTYMEQYGTFGFYYDALDEHLPKYLNREATLAEVSKSIIEAIYAKWED